VNRLGGNPRNPASPRIQLPSQSAAVVAELKRKCRRFMVTPPQASNKSGFHYLGEVPRKFLWVKLWLASHALKNGGKRGADLLSQVRGISRLPGSGAAGRNPAPGEKPHRRRAGATLPAPAQDISHIQCRRAQPTRKCTCSKSARAPFQRICTPMHTIRDDVSCRITVIPVAPTISPRRSEKS
jgi:hypothetical protein